MYSVGRLGCVFVITHTRVFSRNIRTNKNIIYLFRRTSHGKDCLFIANNRIYRLYSQYSIFLFVCLKPVCSRVKAQHRRNPLQTANVKKLEMIKQYGVAAHRQSDEKITILYKNRTAVMGLLALKRFAVRFHMRAHFCTICK